MLSFCKLLFKTFRRVNPGLRSLFNETNLSVKLPEVEWKKYKGESFFYSSRKLSLLEFHSDLKSHEIGPRS